MPTSVSGNQRSSYKTYVDAFKKTLLVFRSEDAHNHGVYGHRNASYNISCQEIQCKDNQILTAYVHSADIPMTTYNINRFNDKFYLYLKDWRHVNFGSTDNGIIVVQLTRRNYTTSQLKTEIQSKLDALVDSTFSTSFDVATGVGSTTIKQDGYTTILTSALPIHKDGSDSTALAVSVPTYTDSTQGGVPVNTVAGTYEYNPVVMNFTTSSGAVSKANIGFLKDPSGNDSVEIKSQPRFEVSIEGTERIQIKRVDLMGFIPLQYGQFMLSSGKSNYLHFGMNLPKWASLSPQTHGDFTDAYNSSGQDDYTKERGSIMQSKYQSTEFGTIKTSVQSSSTFSQRVFFPNIPNLNAMSTINIRSNALRANVRDTGKQSNIIAKIPITVQQGGIINYEPQNPVRFNLGRQNLTNIDIQLTDRAGHLLDFNGSPHDLTILFEVWDVVNIPLHRNSEYSYQNPLAGNMADSQFETFRRLPQPVYDAPQRTRPTAQAVQPATKVEHARSMKGRSRAPVIM